MMDHHPWCFLIYYTTIKCWSSSLLVHLGDFIPKRNKSIHIQNKKRCYLKFITHSFKPTGKSILRSISLYVKMTIIKELEWLPFVNRRYLLCVNWWLSRFGMNDTLHGQSADLYSSPCVCVCSHRHPLLSIQEFVLYTGLTSLCANLWVPLK